MRLITLLNHCEHFSGFAYDKARICQHSRTIEIQMAPAWLQAGVLWLP
jgi:hypothetical protein